MSMVMTLRDDCSITFQSRRFSRIVRGLIVAVGMLGTGAALGDSVNSPNITMNVDTNRAVGAGAGNVAIVINTITIAEISVNEYSAGAGRQITFKVRPGFQFDPTSNVTAQSATIGFNGGGVNVVATVTPAGTADEVITFSLTSGTSAGQDIIRVNGVKLKILSAAGAVGPAQTTVALTTSTAGGAFTEQGIVAANITKGAADRLVFSIEPGSSQAGADLLPAVKIVDFGGNVVTADARTITLALEANPGAATLLGTAAHETNNGVATWVDADDLRLTTAASGYTLRASHSGAAFLSSDTVDSGAFDITGAAPDHLTITQQPADTTAGSDILLTVTQFDEFNNIATGSPVNVTLDSANNPGGWPLLVDTSLTKATVNGVVTWDATDHLRINKAVSGYTLAVSGLGAPLETGEFDVSPAAPSTLRFVQQPASTQEDVAIAADVSVEIVDAFGNRTDSTATVELGLQSTCGGAVTGGSAVAAAGVATFAAVKIDTPCVGVSLEAASGSLTRASSDTFDVTAAPPVAIRFFEQPSDVTEDVVMSSPVRVELVDAAGQRTDSTATVTLTLRSSCGGTLSGGSATAAAGVATFDGISVDTPCAGVTLRAAADGLIDGNSDAFDVSAAVANDNAAGDDAPADVAAPCGACGQGAAVALVPLLVMQLALRRRLKRVRGR